MQALLGQPVRYFNELKGCQRHQSQPLLVITAGSTGSYYTQVEACTIGGAARLCTTAEDSPDRGG
ncbi:MAG TPA: hypothetical protein PKD90_13750 [Phnomibacter sp.]|nr:hypothetical protein [Phnomibacter sp.]